MTINEHKVCTEPVNLRSNTEVELLLGWWEWISDSLPAERERFESTYTTAAKSSVALTGCKEIMSVETYLPFLGRFWMTSTAAWKRFWWSMTDSAIAGTGMTLTLFGFCWRDDWWYRGRSVFTFPKSIIIKPSMINVTQGKSNQPVQTIINIYKVKNCHLVNTGTTTTVDS